MKRIVSFILTLALLVSALAILPVSAGSTTTKLVATEVSLTDGVMLEFYIEADDDTAAVTNATPVTKNGVECFKLTVPISAKRMDDDVTVGLKSGSQAVGDSYTVSVKEALAKMLGGADMNATKELITAMLNYGAAAQKFFGYKTDELVGTPVTDTTALKGASAPKVTITNTSGIYYGATLVLDGTLKLRFYFEGNDREVELAGEIATVVNNGDRCYAEIAVTPDNLNERFNVRCEDAFVKYSALNYLKNKVDDPALSELAASIYAYSKATEKYLAARDCTHVDLENETIQYASLYNKGMRTGTCTACGEKVTETYGKTTADINKYNQTESGGTSYSDKLNIANDILGAGKHFYPHAENGNSGRDLYVEFSFLYNETLANNTAGYLDLFRFENDDEANGHTVFYLNLKNGGILLGTADPTDPEAEIKATLGGYGWHRIGLKLHQEANVNNGFVIYTAKATLYIDGLETLTYDANLYADTYNNFIYTATLGSNGQLAYKDMESNKNLYFYKLSALTCSDDVFIVTADEYARATDSFALNVTPTATGAADTVKVGDGVNLDAKAYFTVNTTIADADIPEKAGNTSGNKVLLVSIDGLRPDALADSEYYAELMSLGRYTLNAQTINPSITMPAHMSMFHSVAADVHNMTSNLYKPSAKLGNGITETLAEAGLTSAMFLDWEKIQCLTKAYNDTERYFISGRPTDDEWWYEASTEELCLEVLDHATNSPTDFTFLYFALGDSMGHDYGWLSDEYNWGVDHMLKNLISLIKALPDDYTVIVTADHGGGGDNGTHSHGSANVVDMTIPMFIIGEGFEGGRALNFGISILDIAPTIADILDVDPMHYWVGKSMISSMREEAIAATLAQAGDTNAKALEVFMARDSWGNYFSHGKIKSFDATSNTLKIGATNNGRTAFSGFQLNKSAMSEWVKLGYRYVSFTVILTADSGTAPGFIDVYTNPYHDEFFASTPVFVDPNAPSEQYYMNGTTVKLDLEALLACTTNGSGLNFILIKDNVWVPTGDAYVTFANITFSK